MDVFKVDELKLYMGSEIKIADGIVLRSPTIGEIVDYGEESYFSMAQTICSTPSSLKVALDDKGYDYMQVKDFDLFIMLTRSLPQDVTAPILGDLDLSSLIPYETEYGEVILSSADRSVVINSVIYEILVTYIRKMHGFKKQVDKAGNEVTRQMLIKVARQDAKASQNKPYKSFLLPLISSLQGRQRYTKEYIRDMGIYEFTNQINRAQIIVQADAALHGSWSGMVDTKKIDKQVFDWMRDPQEDTNTKNKTILKEGAN